MAATLAFYGPIVFGGRVLSDYDASVFFGPQRAYLGQVLATGHIPLWNPFLFMGAPFLANPQTAVLYPPSWIYAALSPEAGYTAQLVLHGLLSAAFMYFFCRLALATHPIAAAVGALAWTFGGFAVGQSGHLNQISAAAWTPAILLAYDRTVHYRSPGWLALGAVALALQLLAGHPQESYMSGLILVLFGLVRAPWRRFWPLLWAGVSGALQVALGVALAGVQLLPTLELSSLSIRGGGVAWADAVAGSVPSYLLPRALFPPYWLPIASSEFLAYVGVAAVAAGFLALLFSPSRLVLFGFLLCGLGVFLAAGENNGYYGWLFGNVPSFDTFRVPARWLFLWDLGAVILGVLGTDWVVRGFRVPGSRWKLYSRVAVVAAVLCVGLAWQQGSGEPFPTRRTPLAWFGLALLVAAAGGLAMFRWPRTGGSIILVLTAAELYAAAGMSTVRQAPPGVLLASLNSTESFLTEDPRARGIRTLSVAQPEYVSLREPQLRATLRDLPDNQLVALLVALKWRDTLTPNEPLRSQILSLDGYDGGVLPLRRFVQLATLLVPADRIRPDGVLLTRLTAPPLPRLLRIFGVGAVIANVRDPLTADAQPFTFGDVRIDLLNRPSPLWTFAGNATLVADDQEALMRMQSARFDSDSHVLLTAQPGADSVVGGSGSVTRWDRPDAEHWQGHVSASSPGYVLQKEAWYPGWFARVDGKDTPLLRADVLFRAVPVPAGEHEVEVWFDPASLRSGTYLSAAGGLCLVALAFFPRARRRWLASRLPGPARGA